VLGAAETVIGLTDRFTMVPDKRRALCAERERFAANRRRAPQPPRRASSPFTGGR